MKKIIITIVFSFLALFAFSQDVIDQIIGVVGNEIIMKSDIENQYIQLSSQGYGSGSVDLKCEILEDLLFQKLLYVQAQKDSIEVTEKEIEGEIDRRLSVFINQYGSEQKLEEYYGKPIKQIKEYFHDIIKEQLMAQRAQQKIIGDTKLTPTEVKRFYDSLPDDSIPVIETYFELSEIVIKPEFTPEDRQEVIDKLNVIREKILAGENFATMAILYSEDQGSAMNGGELGFVSKTDLVPEFAQVAFSLTSPADVSRVVETEYGFHIIQLIEKRGNMMNFRHILLKPKFKMSQLTEAEKKANEIRELIVKDSITFEAAVLKYSQGDTKTSNGKVMNPYYGNSRLTREVVEPYTRNAAQSLKEKEVSKAFLGTDNKGSKVIKIVRLDSYVKEHKATLKDDYQQIQQYAVEAYNSDITEKWIEKTAKHTYIRIDDSYSNCDFEFKDWIKK